MTTGYEQLMSVIETRRSIRKLRPDPVPEAQIRCFLDAARWAPNAGNRQSYRMLVVTDVDLVNRMADEVERAARAAAAALPADLSALASNYVERFWAFRGAPLIVVPIYGAEEELPIGSRGLVDALSSAAAATMNMLLAIHALGLGACWMTGPLVAERELSVLLAVPNGWHMAAIVPVGVPDEAPSPPARRPIEHLYDTRGGLGRS
jgi:nitroreductase